MPSRWACSLLPSALQGCADLGTTYLHVRFLRAEVVSNSPGGYLRLGSQDCFWYEWSASKCLSTPKGTRTSTPFGGPSGRRGEGARSRREPWHPSRAERARSPRSPAGPAPPRTHLCRRFLGLSLGQEAEPSPSSGPGRRSLGPGLLRVPHHLGPGEATRGDASLDLRSRNKLPGPEALLASRAGARYAPHFRPLTGRTGANAFKSRDFCSRGPAPPPTVDTSFAAGAGTVVRWCLPEFLRETTSRVIWLPGSTPCTPVFVGQQSSGLGLWAESKSQRSSLRGRGRATVVVTSGARYVKW